MLSRWTLSKNRNRLIWIQYSPSDVDFITHHKWCLLIFITLFSFRFFYLSMLSGLAAECMEQHMEICCHNSKWRDEESRIQGGWRWHKSNQTKSRLSGSGEKQASSPCLDDTAQQSKVHSLLKLRIKINYACRYTVLGLNFNYLILNTTSTKYHNHY